MHVMALLTVVHIFYKMSYEAFFPFVLVLALIFVFDA